MHSQIKAISFYLDSTLDIDFATGPDQSIKFLHANLGLHCPHRG